MPVENFLNKKTKTLSFSPGQTKKIGEKIAKQFLLAPNSEGAVVIGLYGELGAGKTTFLQGFAKGLGIKEKITSPTFVLMKHFKISKQKSKGRHNDFYHFDCYRVNQPTELLTINWQEIIDNPKNIVAIEWPERIKSILPSNVFMLKLNWEGKNKRAIIIG